MLGARTPGQAHLVMCAWDPTFQLAQARLLTSAHRAPLAASRPSPATSTGAVLTYHPWMCFLVNYAAAYMRYIEYNSRLCMPVCQTRSKGTPTTIYSHSLRVLCTDCRGSRHKNRTERFAGGNPSRCTLLATYRGWSLKRYGRLAPRMNVADELKR